VDVTLCTCGGGTPTYPSYHTQGISFLLPLSLPNHPSLHEYERLVAPQDVTVLSLVHTLKI